MTCLYESSSVSRRWGNHWEIEGTEGHLSANELVLYANQSSYPLEEIYDQVGGERILAAVAVGLNKSDSNFEPILWENPFTEYGISADDDIAKASILSSSHRAVTTGVGPEYGSAQARRDIELWFVLRESANLDNTWVDLPLMETTNLEKRFQSAYIEAYGGDPVKNTAALLQTPFNRLSIMWSAAGWL
ncbi:hypothetical protein CMK14_04295 [Candidatus Poribacteria bacterium]|nr:hypothetical protein [Candidatus Poribacteria bacterium]